MRRGESGEAQDRVFKRYGFSAKGKFGARTYLGCVNGFSARFLWCVDDALVQFLRCVVDVAFVVCCSCSLWTSSVCSDMIVTWLIRSH